MEVVKRSDKSIVHLENLQLPKELRRYLKESANKSKLSESFPSFLDQIVSSEISNYLQRQISVFQSNSQAPLIKFEKPFKEEPAMSIEDMPNFVCQYCSKTFYLKPTLSLHIETEHSTNNVNKKIPSNSPTKDDLSTEVKCEKEVEQQAATFVNRKIQQNVNLNFRRKSSGLVLASPRYGKEKQKTFKRAKKIQVDLKTLIKQEQFDLIPAHFDTISFIAGSVNKGNDNPATFWAPPVFNSQYDLTFEQKQLKPYPKYLCKICNSFFENLKIHKSQEHIPSILFSCQNCESKTPTLFGSFSLLSEHQRYIHEAPYQCLKCNYTSYNIIELSKHASFSHPMSVAANPKDNYQRRIVNSGVCQLCGKGVSEVKKHMTKKHQVLGFIFFDLLCFFLNFTLFYILAFF